MTVNIISKIRFLSPAHRNTIRGILANAHKRNLSKDDIDAFRGGPALTDMSVVSELLNGPKGLLKRKAFGLKQAEIWGPHDLKCKSAAKEIYFASGFINSWLHQSVKAAGAIPYLAAAATASPEDALGAIAAAASEWGASNYLIYKLAYFKSSEAAQNSYSEIISKIDGILGHSESPGIQYAAFENIKDSVSLFAVARRHTNTLHRAVGREFRKSISLSNLVASPVSEDDCAGYVLRATQTSLIDTIHAFMVIRSLKDRLPLANSHIEAALDAEVMSAIDEAIAEVSRLDTPDLATSASCDIDGSCGSMSLYRRSAVFLEFPELLKYRNDIDQVIGIRLVESVSSPIVRWPSDALQNENLFLRVGENFDFELRNSAEPVIDVFYRTYLFLKYLQDPMNMLSLDDDQLQFVFNSTVGLEALILEKELEGLHAAASDNARALVSVLALALYRRRSLDPDIDFDFRERLEQYIIENFDSDIIPFIKQIAEKSPQVANYLAQSLDDVTLQKMYYIIESQEKVNDVRREMLNVIGFALNRIEFIIEAEAIETRSKLSRLRTYFDASRMFVDSVAMGRWLDANPSAYVQQYREIYPRLTATGSSSVNVQVKSGAEAKIQIVHLAETDKFLISQITREAFVEFCSNNEFGIESYLGRRIRHNTLEGVMNNGIDSVLAKNEYQPILAGTRFGEALQSWRSGFSKLLIRMNKEYLRFRDTSTPAGLFLREVDDTDPFTQSNIQQLVNTLRISSADLLHDLVISFCWRQIAPQLESASNFIRVNLAGEAIFSLDHTLSRFSAPEEQRLKAELAEAIRLLFSRVASWFRVPETGFVPATLPELINIIEIDRRRMPNSTLVKGSDLDVKYNGISVHRLYDCLDVLLQNAFKHGKQDSNIEIQVKSSPIPGTNFRSLTISVISELIEEAASDCIERVNKAITSVETGRDMVNEGFTGIKKVKFITKLNEGRSTVEFLDVGNLLELRFTIKSEVVDTEVAA